MANEDPITTSTPANAAANFTLVVSGGELYKDSAAEANKLTDEEKAQYFGSETALVYDAETGWTMSNFTFTTGALTAVEFADNATTLTISGENKISGGSVRPPEVSANTAANTIGISVTGSLTVKSDGDEGTSLTVTAGSVNSGNSCGLYSKGNLTFSDNAAVYFYAGTANDGDYSRGIYSCGDTVTISGGAKVIAIGENAASGNSNGIFVDNADTTKGVITVSGTGSALTTDAGNYGCAAGIMSNSIEILDGATATVGGMELAGDASNTDTRYAV